jgi:hypothetical protein
MHIHWAIYRLTKHNVLITIVQSLKLCILQGQFCFIRVLTEGTNNMKVRARIKIESYRKLVAMQAWKAWRRLPMQTRIWIDIEDMIEDGMRESWKLTKTFNPSWASFTTALFHRLHHFYINEYLEYHSAQQRGWARIDGKLAPIPHVSIQAMEYSMNRKAQISDKGRAEVIGMIPALVVSSDSIVENAITECFVVPALEKIYKEASPRLQDAFVEWFLTTDKSRIHKKGKPFKKSAKEFRELCKEVNVTCNDCVHLVRSPSCLDTLSRDLFGVPRDLNFPTPRVERML